MELPRGAVTDYLEKFDPHIAMRYLEYLTDEKEEQNAGFHDRLAELYLGITMTAKRKGEEGESFPFDIFGDTYIRGLILCSWLSGCFWLG